MVLVIWLSRNKRFAGNWILFTTAILLFAFGMLIQYRLYSDPEYNARNKAAAREEKMQALRTRYIMENYDPVKKQMMGLPPTPAQPIDINQLPEEGVELLALECAHFQLHLDSDLFVLRFCRRLFILRARRLSVMAAAQQLHHCFAYAACRWRLPSLRPAPARASAT